jgi:hypothetical protein
MPADAIRQKLPHQLQLIPAARDCRALTLMCAAGSLGAARAHSLSAARPASGGAPMFRFRDLFQWERFITPSIIRIFYWLTIVLVVLFGLSALATALATMATSPLLGLLMLCASAAGTLIGVIFARIAAEFILIVFRINEHLGAIRQRAEM